MTKIAECYAIFLVFFEILLFAQFIVAQIVQHYDTKRQNPHHSCNCYDAGCFLLKKVLVKVLNHIYN